MFLKSSTQYLPFKKILRQVPKSVILMNHQPSLDFVERSQVPSSGNFVMISDFNSWVIHIPLKKKASIYHHPLQQGFAHF